MPSAVETQPHVNPWIVATAVMFATFMEVLDTTVVNVSLPHIAGSLSASVDEAAWALTSYLVANAIILPMTGWLANYFGRKRMLQAGRARAWALTSYLVANAIILPMTGWLANYFGRKRMLQAAVFGSGALPILCAVCVRQGVEFPHGVDAQQLPADASGRDRQLACAGVFN